jgi:hypothetical protein
MKSQVTHHEFLGVNANPDDGDLRSAVPTERYQMSERSFFDQISDRLRNVHVFLSLSETKSLLLTQRA